MEYKVQINSLENFKAWSGGLTTLNTVRERGGVDTLTVICEDIFSGDTPTEQLFYHARACRYYSIP